MTDFRWKSCAVMAAALLTWPAASPALAAGRLDGLWQMDGYGVAVAVHDGRLRTYETTRISCRPWFTATRAGGGAHGGVRFTGDGIPELTVRPAAAGRARLTVAGSTGSRGLLPIARLPEACGRTTPADPLSTFDVFWQTFAENYPFFRQHGVDWDAVRESHRRLVRPDSSDDELFGVLRSMIEPLQDAHTAVVADDTHRYFGKRAGTPDRAAVEERALEVTDAQLPDTLRTWARGAIAYADLPDRVGYLRISRFAGYTDDDDYAQDAAALDEALDEILTPARTTGAKALRGLILDLRLNRGGSDALGLRIAARLTDRAYLAYRKRARNDPDDPSGRTRPVPVPVRPGPGPRFTGPIAVLTGNLTVSAGETFTQALLARRPAPVRIGQATQGVFSDIMPRTLPNGWEFALPNEEFSTAGGRTFDVTGIPPTIACPVFTPAELDAGADTALRIARDLLTGGTSGPHGHSPGTTLRR
ncbi:S41 family peptidase [Actinoplanes sp. NPDC049681]|uniref:S41 family peptidase n=1 Tax=Actinoplanes sp. NPDC049681 TaxID=3363905 RepID=UPI0037BAABF1